MKNQASFSSKDKSKKIKCLLLEFLFGDCQILRLFPFELIAVPSFFQFLSSHCFPCIMTKHEEFLCAR